MKHLPLFFFLTTFLWTSCIENAKKSSPESISLLPEAGTIYKSGEVVSVEIDLKGSIKPDSILYFLDDDRLPTEQDTLSVQLETANLTMGSKLLTARIFKNGHSEDLTTNIVLFPVHAPVQYGYKVVHVFPHDTTAYTQGLEFHQGFLYESSGSYGKSNVRKVDLLTGKVLQQSNLPDDQFAEGISIVDNKMILLTWREGMGLVYGLSDLKLSGSFPYQQSPEGWGLCFDGNKFWKSDGTNKLWMLGKDNFKEEGVIEVYDDEGPVDQLNELEYIEGKIYANVYQSDKIVIIDPQNGAVTGEIDLSGLLPAKDRFPNTDVLNGIARDVKTNRLFVTGKRWNKLFEIKIVPKT